MTKTCCCIAATQQTSFLFQKFTFTGAACTSHVQFKMTYVVLLGSFVSKLESVVLMMSWRMCSTGQVLKNTASTATSSGTPKPVLSVTALCSTEVFFQSFPPKMSLLPQHTNTSITTLGPQWCHHFPAVNDRVIAFNTAQEWVPIIPISNRGLEIKHKWSLGILEIEEINFIG